MNDPTKTECVDPGSAPSSGYLKHARRGREP